MNTGPDTHPVRRCPPHVVVLFCGASQSGKTTLAQAVHSILIGRGVYPLIESFARPLKRALQQCGVERFDKSFRPLAQAWGDAARALDADFFVDRLRCRIESHEGPAVFLVDDCRFRNEGQVGDLVFRLFSTTRRGDMGEGERGHRSENEWMDIFAHDTFVTDHEEDIPVFATRMADRIMAFMRASEEE